MLDGEVADAVAMVWGYPVPALPCGRRKWPEALRAMAVEKIAAGAAVRKIAAEIGANKLLVAKWVKNAGSADPAPDFIEALPPTAVEATPPGACHADEEQRHNLPDHPRGCRYRNFARLPRRSSD